MRAPSPTLYRISNANDKETIMNKTLPKGHLSCLAPSFRYTPATGTDIAKTFARIKRTLKVSDQKPVRNVCMLPTRKVGSN